MASLGQAEGIFQRAAGPDRLSRRRGIDEAIQFTKRCVDLEDIEVLTYERVQKKLRLVLTTCGFKADASIDKPKSKLKAMSETVMTMRNQLAKANATK